MFNKKLWIFFLFLFLIQNILICENIQFEHLTTSDGLSQSIITTIFQDSRGFMWFGTLDGLNRWDGYDFKVFKHDQANNTSISGSAITCIFEDSSDILWIGTRNGLNRFDRKKESFIRYTVNKKNIKGLPALFVGCVFEDTGSNLWVNSGNYISIFDKKKQNFKRHYKLEKNDLKNRQAKHVFSILQINESTLWLGTRYGLVIFDLSKGMILSDKNNFWNNKSDHQIKKIVRFNADPDIILVSSWKGLFKYSKKNKKWSEINIFRKKNNFLYCIEEDSKGRLWAGLHDRLLVIDLKKNVINRFVHDKDDNRSLSGNMIYNIYKDTENTMWIGTWGDGVDRYDQNKFKFHIVPKTNNLKKIQPILSNNNTNTIWIGSEDGLYQYNEDKNSLENVSLHKNGKKVYVLTLALDENKNIWVGTFKNGLGLYNVVQKEWFWFFTSKNNKLDLTNALINHVYVDVNNNVWLGTDIGFFRISVKKSLTNYEIDKIENFIKYDKKFRKINISTFIPDKEKFWLGTWGNGIYLFDPQKGLIERELKKKKKALISNKIFTIHKTNDNVLWIGSYSGGLSCYNIENDKFKNYVLADGLPNNSVFGILEDKKGRLWLSTFNGMSCFNILTDSFKNYDISDGLSGNEFTQGGSYNNKNGIMYFSNTKGLNYINPEVEVKNSKPPLVVITALRKYNKIVGIGDNPSPDMEYMINESITEADDLVLSYKDSYISFEFAALSFTAPEKNLYAYKMEGYDNDWVYTDAGNRFAPYTRLSPGSYTFRVKASNNDGIWNETGTSLKVTVIPPPWRTWWAYFIYVLLFFSTIFVGYKLRVRSLTKRAEKLSELVDKRTKDLVRTNVDLKKANKLKSEFLGIAAHDLKNPLQAIMGYSELIEKLLKGNKKIIKPIDRIKSSSQKMLLLIREFLEKSQIDSGKLVLNKEKISITSVLENVINDNHSSALNKKQVISFLKEKELFVYGDPLILRQVIDNLISNAIKYSPVGATTIIKTGESDSKIVTDIIDEGPGLTDDDLNKVFGEFQRLSAVPTGGESSTGLGLSIVEKFTKIHNGSIDVFNNKDKGCTFRLILPCSQSEK